MGVDVEFDLLGVDVEFVLFGSGMAFVLFAVVTAEGEGGRTIEKILAATTRVTALVPKIRGNLLGIVEKEPTPIGDREGWTGGTVAVSSITLPAGRAA